VRQDICELHDWSGGAGAGRGPRGVLFQEKTQQKEYLFGFLAQKNAEKMAPERNMKWAETNAVASEMSA